MERWGDKGTAAPAPGRARRYTDQPSFSSTLLDAIYKSMDEPDDGVAAAVKKQTQDLHYSYYYKASLAGSYRASRAHATTSSSSECSSYGGFSSSEAESSQHRRLRPIRTSVAASGEAPAPAPDKTKKAAKNKPGANIRAKLRDLRKPASPGARLAGFLNAIFNGKRAPPTPPSASRAAAAESACSTASSYSRSCLSKTPSTRGQPKRTVRFMDSDGEAAAAVPAAGVERRRVQVGVVELERMLLHRMEMDSDEDDEDEESSDASSDLFELENLAAVAPAAGGAAAYRDELPVYETTRVVLNRAIGHGHGHGYAHGRSTRVV
ncbi:protein BIG GRAIN 1 [Panicum miliaceum]|uniref:Protein BIG GRAIN 1 n=1 Tax=Panicum miliaceum TaxID=4540 RepID=A0A3L6TST8_PANMI|nr:protein BIG GRAIN 1 [Panicum miliaceum]